MSNSPGLAVEPLTDANLDEVIGIHLVGLGYSVNSLLGRDHLAFLYQTMARDPQCYVGVALQGRRPIGVISGTVDGDHLKTHLIRALSVAQIVRLASRLMFRPSLLIKLWEESIIAAPVKQGPDPVVAVLTAIAVDASSRREGAGRELVRALEGFFSANSVKCYRLDTLVTNAAATAFYEKLGFSKVAERAGSHIFVKVLER